MSLRNLWVLSSSNQDFGKVLFSRNFPTVEKRHKRVYGSTNVIPDVEVFASLLVVKLGLSSDSKQFVESRDKACRIMQLPVFEISDGKNEIWPLVVIQQNSYIACCLPLLEKSDEDKKEELLKISSVSVGFAVVIGILNVLATLDQNPETCPFVELDNFLTLSMPFGTPSDMELLCAAAYLHIPPHHNFVQKQPSWKPVDYKGKQHIAFNFTEYIRCVQSNHPGFQPTYEIYGQVAVKAELEGVMNDVSVSINNSESSQSLHLESIIVHPSVQIHTGTTSAFGLFRRLRFTPPLHHFILFHYRYDASKDLPIQGVFKMLGEGSVELLLQLKLSEKVKNSFEFCDAVVNFFNRGPVKSFDYNSNHGIAKISEDKHSLKWSLGTKFPRDLEVILTSKIEFKDAPLPPYSDPFCCEKNCYAQISFRQINSNPSGCSIDPKTVTVSPICKPRITIDRSVQSAEFRVWNNYGDLPFPVNITDKFVPLCL